MVNFPIVNGNTFDYSSVEVWVDGRPYRGVKSINYKDSLKGTKVRGTHAQPLGRTRGEYDADGDIEFYRETWNDIRNALGPGYMERVFDVTVQYQEVPSPIQVDRLRGVRISENNRSNAQGADALTVKLTLDILLPIEDSGIAPINNPAL